ncbi:MAG: translocation/assembly module TamB [Ferruginibacter sp.]|nr:translocation/assembly module TamB [Ferruginibacter sp.]
MPAVDTYWRNCGGWPSNMSKKILVILPAKFVLNITILLLFQVIGSCIYVHPAYGQIQSFPDAEGFNQFKAALNFMQKLSPAFHRPNDSIPINFVKKDSANVNRYQVKGMLYFTRGNVSISLNDSLVLNYRTWNIPSNNRLSFTPGGILVTGFVISSDSSSISVTNTQNFPGDSVAIALRNINIGDITGLYNIDSLGASGLVDASIQAAGLSKGFPAVTATAFVRNMQLMQQPLGNLQAEMQWVNKNTIHTTFGLTENDNLVSGNGNLFLNNPQQQFDIDLDIQKLQIASLQGFFKNIITVLSGNLNGLLEVTGNFKQPQWKGAVNIDSAQFSVNQSGTVYSLNQQKISFDYPTIHFDRFTIKDSLDRALVFNGNLSGMDKGYAIDLDLNATDFTLINAPKAINNQVYGYAGIGTMMSIKGTTENPLLKGDIQLNEKTDVTLVLPGKNSDKDVAGSVVRFIDKDTFRLPQLTDFKPAAAPMINLSKYINRNLNFHLDKQAALTIIIDPATGDELKVQGDAKLNGGVDSAGHLVMAGTYVLNSGYYELNYQFLKKRFNLVPGSTITFGGNPLDAQINIRAEYIANTASKDLLGNEVGAVEASIARSFKQNIPFRVILYLKGSLNKPEISFDIQLPQNPAISGRLRTTIENKLVQLRGDIAAINKQVFALLALERFVGEQSTDFFKGNGADFSDINKESVSKFLSAALDQVASDLFKGINVDLNLNSFKDFTNNLTTQKTDLNVEVSKNFLNDRLNVTVGRNFGIESQDGSAKAAQQKGSRFLPDVTVNYKLSTDGRYMLRSYNKNPFEVILDGYIVETGIAFIVTMDYEKYRELFINKNKKAGNK